MAFVVITPAMGAPPTPLIVSWIEHTMVDETEHALASATEDGIVSWTERQRLVQFQEMVISD